MAWTTPDDVRLITSLNTTEISDADLISFISKAQKEVTNELSLRIIREQVLFIDSTRQNDIDGSNTTFYIKKWKGNYLSDTNFDDSVTTSDVTLFSVDNDSAETSAAPSTITHDLGQWTVSTAPENVDIFVTYSYSPFDMDTPNQLVKLACEYLAGAYAFLKRDGGKSKDVKFGNVSIKTGKRQSYASFYNKYKTLVEDLKISDNGGAIWGIAKEII